MRKSLNIGSTAGRTPPGCFPSWFRLLPDHKAKHALKMATAGLRVSLCLFGNKFDYLVFFFGFAEVHGF